MPEKMTQYNGPQESDHEIEKKREHGMIGKDNGNCLDTPVNHMQWAVPEERGESLQKDFCFAFWPCRYKT